MKRLLVILLSGFLLAACSEYKHEPVRLLPRNLVPETTGVLREVAVPTKAPLQVAPVAPHVASTPTPSPQLAAVDMMNARPAGLLEGDAAPRLVQPGESTGNDAFRRALQERFARENRP